MQARGMLMIEHRLIERMIAQMERHLESAESAQELDTEFVDQAVDFIRTYADRTHHGKEEDILFAELENRSLSDEDDRMMRELKREHVIGRETTKALVEANTRYRRGDSAALEEAVEYMRKLVDMYPEHIRKEDEEFFPAARNYFTEEEDQSMLESFREFDRRIIHEVYESRVEAVESGD